MNKFYEKSPFYSLGLQQIHKYFFIFFYFAVNQTANFLAKFVKFRLKKIFREIFSDFFTISWNPLAANAVTTIIYRMNQDALELTSNFKVVDIIEENRVQTKKKLFQKYNSEM